MIRSLVSGVVAASAAAGLLVSAALGVAGWRWYFVATGVIAVGVFVAAWRHGARARRFTQARARVAAALNAQTVPLTLSGRPAVIPPLRNTGLAGMCVHDPAEPPPAPWFGGDAR